MAMTDEPDTTSGEIVKGYCQSCGRPVYVSRLQIRLFKGPYLLRILRCDACIRLTGVGR